MYKQFVSTLVLAIVPGLYYSACHGCCATFQHVCYAIPRVLSYYTCATLLHVLYAISRALRYNTCGVLTRVPILTVEVGALDIVLVRVPGL